MKGLTGFQCSYFVARLSMHLIYFNTSLFNLKILEMYVHDITVGSTVVDGKPEVVKETSATALVNGNNLLGPVSVQY